MRTEDEIKKQLKNFEDQTRNLACLYEQTGAETFNIESLKSSFSADALLWVLGKTELTDTPIVVDNVGNIIPSVTMEMQSNSKGGFRRKKKGGR
jgi:hypothetical protein